MLYDEVGADDGPNGQQGKVEESNNSNAVGAVEKTSRSLPLLVQGNSECPECGKTFTSNTALSLHKRFFGENCIKTAREQNKVNRGERKSSDSEQSGVGPRKIGLDNSCSTEKRNTVQPNPQYCNGSIWVTST